MRRAGTSRRSRVREPVPARFDRALARHGLFPLSRLGVRTLQVNLGKLCNQACRHCHVDAGPRRTEAMDEATAGGVIELLARHPRIECMDLTGGAPELNPHFRLLVRQARRLGRRVIDRCNLTVLAGNGAEERLRFLAEERVEIVASLPCYAAENVDSQRGNGVYARSIQALKRLNRSGYGDGLRLDLAYNPGAAALPGPQEALEAAYREQLGRRHGIRFHRLLTLTNMPINRFARFLDRTGRRKAYMNRLAARFNPAAVGGLMCRTLLSVGWDGRLYDCDFNQALELPIGGAGGLPPTLRDVGNLDRLRGRPVATGDHCFGCTAGAGSGCSGAIAGPRGFP